ncbi:MAG: hypothetical protein JWM89_3860 [Acidimicrobiales bacterium]|nr:hypothetical protein [Acidimicrobiales bacterium]
MAFLRLLVMLYIIAVVGVIVLSWFPQRPDTAGWRLFVMLRRITDPVLVPIRRIIPPIGGVLDLSPTILLIVLFALYTVLH